MNKLILATAATLMFGASAFAQEAPATIYGGGPASAERAAGAGNTGAMSAPDLGIDFMPTASVDNDGGYKSNGVVSLDDVTNPSANDNISGK